MSNILINQIWQHKKAVYRILYVDRDIDLLVWVNLDDAQKTFPEEITLADFDKRLEDNSIKELNIQDQFANLDLLDEKSINKYERSWDIIKSVVRDEPLIFDKKYFNAKCNELAEVHGVSRQTVQRLLFRYWHNGKSKLGIVPKYYNSGGKGKEKNLTLTINGRQRTDRQSTIILDEQLKHKIRKGYKRWYLRVKQASKRVAYSNFIRTSFKSEWKSKEFAKVPSFRQFVYWGEKEIPTERKLRSKKGDIIFDKDLRITEGSSANSVNGPGFSQIDSTPSDMELVSEIDRKTPIGCPTLYIISDVYSAMIVGLLVTLENPSYTQASEALYNSFTNKGDFFKRSLLYQIDEFEFTEDDWPCEYIPYSIVADRGIELIGKNSESLIEDLGIHIENKESYRPELKGMIENHFQLLHKDLKGLDENTGLKDIDDGRRGARKARKTARFTMREYLAIIIKIAIKYNKHAKLSNYPIDKEMPLDDLYTPTPVEVFKWGLMHKSGKLRSNKIENLRERMLPRGTGKLTKKGIEFLKGWYLVPLHHKLRDLQLKTQRKITRVEVSYDPYNLNYLNVFYEGEIIRCELNTNKSPIYKDKTLWDIKHLRNAQSKSLNTNNEEGIYADIDTLQFASNILAKRKDQKPNSKTGSKSVRKNRENDKKIERKNRKNHKSESGKKKQGKIVSMNHTNLEEPNDLDFINRLLDGE
ncbi:Mu transposase C-terminal domain-containing protein [Ekhidna sp.]|jgi:hypothetical protein|uniref:Mu transposase C-terminal domain-containing protein n=1 Tax=Ekhidna sp. TaxID=2608089 RepID=UPI0032ED77FC